MIKNKYINFIILASLALFMGACGEELNTTEVTTPSHSVLKVSQSGNENTININQHIDFADVSQGIESREWLFPKTDVTVEGNPQDAQVRGVFHKAGTWEVKLSQVFKNNAYVGNETTARETNKLDTTFVVNVLPAVELNTIKANLLLIDGTLGDEIEMSPSTPTEIPFGSVLRFSYEATGNPTQIRGALHGAELVAEDPINSTFDVKYVTLDKVYSFAPVFVRPQPLSSDTLLVMDFVKCVRSSEPLVLENITNSATKKVNLIYSRGLNTNSANAEDYSVTINTAKDVTLNPAVTSAYVSPDNASILVLEIGDELVYSDDIVTVTYSGNSLESQDAALADMFTDQVLENSDEDLLKLSNYNYGFENTSISYTGGDPSWLGGFVPDILEMTNEQASEGTNSLKISRGAFTGTGANASAISAYENGLPHTFAFTENENNKLYMKYDVYVEKNGGVADPASAGFESNIRIHLSNKGGDWQEAAHPFANLEEGQWHTFSNVVSVNNPREEFNLIIKIAHTGSEAYILHLDNIRLMRFYPRP